MSPKLTLQSPYVPGGLLEALLDASKSSHAGGAIFAWTNRSGAKALLDDEVFREFLEEGTFDLVVGVDAITDPAALDLLTARSQELENLSVHVFEPDPTGLFHPKLAWFVASDEKVTLIVGSANLTMGGLKNNWEAFVVDELAPPESSELLDQLNFWIDQNEHKLLDPDDEKILTHAEGNKGKERDVRRAGSVPDAAPAPPANLEVLVAEIPKAGNRWQQANFDRATYVEFFGASIGSQIRIFLRHVTDDSRLGELESRPSVEVGSMNYRFELAAARGRSYPDADEGRPIGVFVRMAPETFIYQLLLPGDNLYAAFSQFIEVAAGPANQRMRRVRTNLVDVQQAVPASPLWSISPDDL
jgi:hypothetical protein